MQVAIRRSWTPQGEGEGGLQWGMAGGDRALARQESLESVPTYGQNPGESERVNTIRRTRGARSLRRHRLRAQAGDSGHLYNRRAAPWTVDREAEAQEEG